MDRRLTRIAALLVATVTAVPAPVNTPLAPVEGAVNVTAASGTGLPPVSRTVVFSFVVNTVPTAALCGVPAAAVMLAGCGGAAAQIATPGPLTSRVYDWPTPPPGSTSWTTTVNCWPAGTSNEKLCGLPT